jgi:transcriptional regulator with XRE-family HTH domain
MHSKNQAEQDLKILFSKKLKELRQKSKKTLWASADLLDMDYSQYYRMLSGKHLPRLETLIKVNKLYHLDMNWWFNDLIKLSARKKSNICKNIQETELLALFRKLKPQARNLAVKILKDLT